MKKLISLFVLSIIFILTKYVRSEYRKLIPVCANSCTNPKVGLPSNCFCDSKCSLMYNDCCLDAPYRTIRVNIKRRHNIHCVFVHGENLDLWMVDTCKADWLGHSHIREKCMDQNIINDERNDIIASLPVTNPKEGVTFKNYYCALCNEEEAENLVEWQVKALCSSTSVTRQDVLQNLTFLEEKQQWGVWKWNALGDRVFNECYLLFQRPVGITDGFRQCMSGLVSTCPPSWKNIATRRKCKSYVDPVKWPEGPVYKNMDCAICHNKTRENFRCVYDVSGGSSAVMLSLAMPVDLNSMGQWL